MKFDPTAYGPGIAAILKLDGNGERLMPLALGRCSSPEAISQIQVLTPAALFVESHAPDAALSGLYLYFSCNDLAHEVAQSVRTPDGAFWHGIVHRQEPDPDNARYWFRQVGAHPVFPELAAQAHSVGLPGHEQGRWDPMRFVEVCDRAREQPDSPLARMALEVQRAEWQLLFDYCARSARRGSSAH